MICNIMSLLKKTCVRQVYVVLDKWFPLTCGGDEGLDAWKIRPWPGQPRGARARACDARTRARGQGCAANLRTKILDFRGFDSVMIVHLKGWNSRARGGFDPKFRVNGS